VEEEGWGRRPSPRPPADDIGTSATVTATLGL
jgi:hypothetical protein